MDILCKILVKVAILTHLFTYWHVPRFLVNEWYIVECNNSTPYLPAALNRLEVLGVNLVNQTVTVSMPKAYGCQNPVGNSSLTMSMNLGGSPFFFSKSHNKFVFEGCGTAAMMTDDDSMVIGCSVVRRNATHNGGNKCYGIGCCQTAIPRYLRSYSINITGLGDQEDIACGSAFLVDQTNSYDEQRFSDPFIYRNASFIPVSLLWTLTDSDQFTCCNERSSETRKVDMFNGSRVDTLKCYSSSGSLLDNPYLMDGCGDSTVRRKQQRHSTAPSTADHQDLHDGGLLARSPSCRFLFAETVFFLSGEATVFFLADRNLLPAKNPISLLLIDLLAASSDTGQCPRGCFPSSPPTLKTTPVNLVLEETSKYAKTGCNDTCGNVRIPYPLGIGAACSANEWYIVDCNHSTPHLSALNNLEVLSVNLENQTVTVGTPMITNCQNPLRNSSEIMGIDLGRSPFLFSKSHNKFVFEGSCGTAVLMMDDGSVVTGFSTTCRSLTLSDRKKCFGMGDCCETAIPHYLRSYSISLIGALEEEDGGCWSAFLVDETSYDQGSWFSERPFAFKNNSFVHVSLLWTLDQVTCCYHADHEKRVIVDMIDGTTVDAWECRARSYSSSPLEGNLYLIDGCEYQYDEEQPEHTEECRRCKDKGGYCNIENMYDVDHLLSGRNYTCYYPYYEKNSLGVILGVSISMGVLFLVAFSFVMYKWIKKAKEKRQRKRFFKRNGGLLLKQQEETDPSLVDKTIHFTSRELQKATDNFNENRILGRGGQGTVYKGMLVDGRIVAVKKSKIVDESQLEHFVNEVVILSQINHRNVVKLLGCCLETEVPVLVSEFIPNGTLYDRLHNETNEFPISLDTRLQIATEVAVVIKEGTRDELLILANLAMRCLNLSGKYRPTMKEVSIELETIRRSHIPSMVQSNIGLATYAEELSMPTFGKSSSTFLSFNESIGNGERQQINLGSLTRGGGGDDGVMASIGENIQAVDYDDFESPPPPPPPKSTTKTGTSKSKFLLYAHHMNERSHPSKKRIPAISYSTFDSFMKLEKTIGCEDNKIETQVSNQPEPNRKTTKRKIREEIEEKMNLQKSIKVKKKSEVQEEESKKIKTGKASSKHEEWVKLIRRKTLELDEFVREVEVQIKEFVKTCKGSDEILEPINEWKSRLSKYNKQDQNQSSNEAEGDSLKGVKKEEDNRVVLDSQISETMVQEMVKNVEKVEQGHADKEEVDAMNEDILCSQKSEDDTLDLNQDEANENEDEDDVVFLKKEKSKNLMVYNKRKTKLAEALRSPYRQRIIQIGRKRELIEELVADWIFFCKWWNMGENNFKRWMKNTEMLEHFETNVNVALLAKDSVIVLGERVTALHKKIVNLKPKKLEMPWQTEKNFVNCGIFALRHMETYMGKEMKEWKKDRGILEESSGKQHDQLLDLRYKYLSKILLSDINILHDEVTKEVKKFEELDEEVKKQMRRNARKRIQKRKTQD
ncbi:hypothetical protein E3N88_42070 [Mikania micrantha]|uniref:Protein kinase domain-containing protein n=1 Tax=Mikania micrantha TaxID=192012 RepID=A0A5N6LIV8_9ASTR|nr:hypothetical protein E3N88_42070 [Mikania micrantha]